MRLSFRCLVWFAAVVVLTHLTGEAPLSACDTPVYRYAMYRWEPTPYELYFFHREAPGEADKQVQELVDRLGRRDEKSRANLVYLPVNLAEDEKLVGVPADVKQGWLAKENPPVPSYMLVTPLGQQVYFGQFDAQEIEKLITSPVRDKFAAMLGDGNTGVLLFIEGKDEKANEAALEMLGALQADVEVGKIKLYAGAADMFPPGVGPGPGRGGAPRVEPPAEEKPGDAKPGDAAKKDEPKQSVGLIRIARDDPAEQWLLQQLQAAERDLDKYANEPMVFVVYGRGRALPPYIGAGITRENMLDCLYFISGACSCTVKEQNPGVDLLVRYNWEAAAQKMAEKFAGEEGADRFGVDNLFPELIFSPPKPKQPKAEATAEESSTSEEIPKEPKTGGAPVEADPATTTNENETNSGDTNASVTNADPTPESQAVAPKNVDTKQTPNEIPADAAKADPSGNASESAEKTVALATHEGRDAAGDHAPGESAEQAANSVWYTVGIGLGVAMLVLIGATILFYRPK